MKCAKAENWMMDYLYGELAARRVLRLEGHLRECRMCSEKLTRHEATLREFRRLESLQDEPREVDPSVGARILAAAYRQRPEDRQSAFRFVLHPAFSAAVMIVLISGVLVYTQTSLVPTRERKQLARVAEKYEGFDQPGKAKSRAREVRPPVEEQRAVSRQRAAEPPAVSADKKASTSAIVGRALAPMAKMAAPPAPSSAMLDEVVAMKERGDYDLGKALERGAREGSLVGGEFNYEIVATEATEAEGLIVEDAFRAKEEKDAVERDAPLEVIDRRARDEYERGNLEFANERYDEAIVHYQNVVQAGPDSDLAAISQHQTAVSFRNMRKFDMAIQTYAEIVKRYPDYGKMAQVLIEYGDSYSAVGEYERALENYLLCARRFPDQAPVLTARIREASSQQSIKTNLRQMGYIK